MGDALPQEKILTLSFRKALFIGIVMVLFVGVSFVLGRQTSLPVEKTMVSNLSTASAPEDTNSSPTLNPTTAYPTPSEQHQTKWRTHQAGHQFSFEYPSGWHVAELWGENYAENGVVFAIDPEPISMAPRGGPIATFEITVLNGNNNPNEILQERIGEFNEENYYDISSEKINATIGEVHHYRGKITGEMYQGEPVEKYFFTFETTINDPANQRVVIASMSLKDDSVLSGMLNHIVLSFKKTSP